MIQYFEMNESHIKSAINLWANTRGIDLTIGDSEDEIKKYLIRNTGFSFIGLDSEKNQLIGSILCGHDGRRGFIYHLAVSEKYRNKQIAQELIARSLEKLYKIGIKRCMVMVKETNYKAQLFWSKNGWSQRNDLRMFSFDLMKNE